MNTLYDIDLMELMEEFLLEDIAAVKEHYPSIDDDTFNKLIRLDPTFKENVDRVGTYGRWLLELYKKTNQIPDEHIKELLITFDKNKNHFPIEKRDINRYKSVEELEDMLNDTEINLTQNQLAKQHRKEKHKVNLVQDANYLGQFGNYEVYIPETYAASCKLGSGTTWCTASTSSENYFDSYTRQGNLYILINVNDPSKKYQIHFETNSFMNKDDRNVSTKELMNILKDSPELYTDFITKLKIQVDEENRIIHRFEHVYNMIQNGVDYSNNDYSQLINLIAEYFEVSPDEVTETERGNYYQVGEEGTYLVLSERDADDEFDTSVRNLIDEVGVDKAFGKGVNLDLYIDHDIAEEKMFDFYEDDFYEQYADDSEYIIEQMYDENLLRDNDFDEFDEYDQPIFSSCNKDEDELATIYANDRKDDMDYIDFLNYLGYYGDSLNSQLQDILDIDLLIYDLREEYGRGTELARYDGEEHEIGEIDGDDYFAYRIN